MTIDADGVVFPIRLLVLQETIQLFIASVDIYDVVAVSPWESEDGGGRPRSSSTFFFSFSRREDSPLGSVALVKAVMGFSILASSSTKRRYTPNIPRIGGGCAVLAPTPVAQKLDLSLKQLCVVDVRRFSGHTNCVLVVSVFLPGS